MKLIISEIEKDTIDLIIRKGQTILNPESKYQSVAVIDPTDKEILAATDLEPYFAQLKIIIKSPVKKSQTKKNLGRTSNNASLLHVFATYFTIQDQESGRTTPGQTFTPNLSVSQNLSIDDSVFLAHQIYVKMEDFFISAPDFTKEKSGFSFPKLYLREKGSTPTNLVGLIREYNKHFDVVETKLTYLTVPKNLMDIHYSD